MKRVIIIVFFLLMYLSTSGGYSETFLRAGMSFDDAMKYSTLLSAGRVLLALISMTVVPFICRMINKEKLPYRKGKILCLCNSILLLVISEVMKEFINISFIGLYGAIFFYFFNKWTFVSDIGNGKTASVQNDDKEVDTSTLSIIKEEEQLNTCGANTEDLLEKANEVVLESVETTPEPVIEKSIRTITTVPVPKQHKRSTGLIITTIVLSILIVTSAGLNIWQYNQIKKLENEPKQYIVEQNNEEYLEYWSQNHNKLDFYDANIVFVIDGYGDYYYTYDQMKTVTQGIGEYTYWAYNKGQAISRGYKAFPNDNSNRTFGDYLKQRNNN